VPYELIDHTGDTGVLVRAPTLEALFAEAAAAMFAILAEAADPHPSATDRFEIPPEDPADALHAFLSELLYRFSAERRMYVTFLPRPGAVEAGWEPYDPVRHPLRTEIKAVTFHQLETVRENGGWRARVIFDL
jgi:SHS2 domain-containing protein